MKISDISKLKHLHENFFSPFLETQISYIEISLAWKLFPFVQGPEFQVRIVPLDRDQKQEAWVPEFIVTVLSTEGNHVEVGSEKIIFFNSFLTFFKILSRFRKYKNKYFTGKKQINLQNDLLINRQNIFFNTYD